MYIFAKINVAYETHFMPDIYNNCLPNRKFRTGYTLYAVLRHPIGI